MALSRSSCFCSAVPLSAVESMNVFDEGVTTMKVRWEEAHGATGYRLLYKSINATEPQEEKEVSEPHRTRKTFEVY